MTTYAHDAVARSIVAVWTTGAGSATCRVARVPASTDDALARHLAQALDRLSQRIWRTYSDPGPADLHPEKVEQTLRRPNMPVSLLLGVAEDPIEEAGARGRPAAVRGRQPHAGRRRRARGRGRMRGGAGRGAG